MEYTSNDRILSLLHFADPTPVRVVVDDECVRLYVGPRDWQWDRKTGGLIGAGTGLCAPQALGAGDSLSEKGA